MTSLKLNLESAEKHGHKLAAAELCIMRSQSRVIETNAICERLMGCTHKRPLFDGPLNPAQLAIPGRSFNAKLRKSKRERDDNNLEQSQINAHVTYGYKRKKKNRLLLYKQFVV